MPTKTPTYYVFHGDDDLRIEEEVRKLRAAMGSTPEAGMNISEFDGETADVAEILNAASSYPFLADKRLVIVKQLLAWLTRKGAGNTGKKSLDLLVAELPKLPDWARLVFWENVKLPESHAVIRLVGKSDNGIEKAYTVPKDSTDWIVKRAHDVYGAKIDHRAAAALASVTTGSLRRADNELVKLVSYVDYARPISEEDVALLTPYVAEANMFEMVDALAEGRGQAAARLIHRLLDQQEDVFALYGMIVRQFRLLLLAKEHLVSGGYPGAISEALGVHKFVAEKLARQARGFSLAQLEHIYRRLQDYDLKMKTGQIKPELALDLLIAGLAQK